MIKNEGKHVTMVILILSISYSKLYKGSIVAEIAQCKHYSTCHFVCVTFWGQQYFNASLFLCTLLKNKLQFTAVQVVPVILTNY